jgi:hypothetical protein
VSGFGKGWVRREKQLQPPSSRLPPARRRHENIGVVPRSVSLIEPRPEEQTVTKDHGKEFRYHGRAIENKVRIAIHAYQISITFLPSFLLHSGIMLEKLAYVLAGGG